MKIFIRFAFCLLVPIILFGSCIRQELPDRAPEAETGLSVAQARKVFESRMAQTSTRTFSGCPRYSFDPGCFTPRWEKSHADNDPNTGVSSITVPVILPFRYGAEFPDPAKGEDSVYRVPVAMCMVVAKKSDDNHIPIYIVALIPDREYAERTRGDFGERFMHGGSGGGFSGVAIYRGLSGRLIGVGRYSEGKCIAWLYLGDIPTDYDRTQHADCTCGTHHEDDSGEAHTHASEGNYELKLQLAERIVGPLRIVYDSSSGLATRSDLPCWLHGYYNCIACMTGGPIIVTPELCSGCGRRLAICNCCPDCHRFPCDCPGGVYCRFCNSDPCICADYCPRCASFSCACPEDGGSGGGCRWMELRSRH